MKPFLLITGMHRSGTSFLARALNLQGVYLGEYDELISNEWSPVADNPRGNWENKKSFELTEKTLEFSNCSWDNIPDTIRINDKIGNDIKKFTKKLGTYPSLASGIKDPRILICIDSWKKYLPKKFIIIGIFRNPLKVSESLKNRNHFSYEKSLDLWQIYNEQLLKILEKHDGFLLNFDWPKNKLFSQLDLISVKLNLAKNIDLSDWYSQDLFLSDKTFQKNHPLDDQINSLYSKLKKRSEENNKVRIKFRHSQKELNEITENLHKEIQKQGNYFKILNDNNNNELSKSKIFIEKLNQDIKNKEDELHKNQHYISQLNQDIQNKESELTNSKDYISNLKQDIQNKESELTNSKDHISKLKQDIQNKEAELTNSKDYIANLKQDLQNKETDQTKSKDFVSQLSKELSDKNMELKNLENQILDLKEKFDLIKETKPRYYSSRL